ncbi:histidine ABC transporter substrate-binding protein [Burkholderia ubonensis]|uniref:ABC transporter substrate-binding protein n=1 Tax=Burkholderia ubonensis TaxID=101571 RepID=UPI000751E99C|nr:ABC transporter substrate-binding protein [Burkholderia ubonensis]KVN88581.1 histidine ABC transporter substrate-binding protein [Burkholderia ubonensis]KVO12050.1 histidine ABC transporter substrate-binding protein [Burkholderia ubonensis]KVO17431.1 histidine ABC transporter substrate-binding protein [Burkholderia ubonensis]KVQ78852.1 histidine ABC transporter substrate-binding protein [Burkholderia ubonensis]
MQIRRLKTVLLAAAAILSAPAAHAAGGACGDGKTVHFAGITWESGAFAIEVLRQILEKGYGCKTDVVPGSTAATETALARNDLQVWAEQWTGRSEITAKAVASGAVKLIGDTLPGGTKEGWFVPEYVVKGDPARNLKPVAPGLASLDDLPKFKQVFADEEEPDKGRFLNCPTGWDCERVNTRLMRVLKLDRSYTNFHPGTGAALDAAIASAYQRGAPIVFYYWGPAALMAKYKFVALKMPAYNEACWKTLRDESSTHQCASSYMVSRLTVGVSRPFADANPDLVAMFEKVRFPMDFLNQTILDMTTKKIDGAAMATQFLRTRPDMWKPWVPNDVAQKIAGGLKGA